MYFLAVNFHYIESEKKYLYPGIYPISPLKLRNQVEELSEHFEFINQDQLLSALRGENSLPDKCCMLTFDDGLKCQYENAIPILEEFKIPAMFFIPTLPYSEKKACLVRKIHYVRANLKSEIFLTKVKKEYFKITGKIFNFSGIDETRAINQYRYDEEKVAKLKYLLNNLLPLDIREKIIKKIFSEMVHDEREFWRKFYLNQKMVVDLARRSFLGIHSHNHYPLAILRRGDLKNDLKMNLETISKIVGNDCTIKGISYPYGNMESISPEVSFVARSLGLEFGFTMERSFNRSINFPLLFARVDTNDAPGGKDPCFAFREDGGIEVLPNGKFGERRRLFCRE